MSIKWVKISSLAALQVTKYIKTVKLCAQALKNITYLGKNCFLFFGHRFSCAQKWAAVWKTASTRAGKVNFLCTCVIKIVFLMQIYLVHQLLNCKIRVILSSKNLISYTFLSHYWSCSNIGYQYFLFEVNHWLSSLTVPENLDNPNRRNYPPLFW